MNLGIIARSDRGGIAAQTYELVQNLKPAKVLVVKPGLDRGHMSEEFYPGAQGCDDPISYRAACLFLNGLDTVLTVEGWYGDEIPTVAGKLRVKRILVANPELYRQGTPHDLLLTPTNWMRGAMPPETVVLPHPVSLERFKQRHVREVKTWYHTASPAMLDRNGTEFLKRALEYIRVPTTLYIREERAISAYQAQIGKVKVMVLPGHATPWYWQHWPSEVDAFVLPRRYGGLCLPMQEAAAQGLPVVTTGVAPQMEWFPSDCLVPPHHRSAVGMKGGRVYCYDVEPAILARRMDLFTSGEVNVPGISSEILQWARERSWQALGPVWEGITKS